MEREHAQELKTLDCDIDALWDRRINEGMTESEVLNEWDKRRGDKREQHSNKEGHIEYDIEYHEKMISKHKGLFGKTRERLLPPTLVSRRNIIKSKFNLFRRKFS